MVCLTRTSRSRFTRQSWLVCLLSAEVRSRNNGTLGARRPPRVRSDKSIYAGISKGGGQQGKLAQRYRQGIQWGTVESSYPHQKIFGSLANCLHRARLHTLVDALAHSNALGTSLAAFVARNTPTVGDLIKFTQHHSVQYNGQTKKTGRILSTVALARTNIEACATVQREHAAIEGS